MLKVISLLVLLALIVNNVRAQSGCDLQIELETNCEKECLLPVVGLVIEWSDVTPVSFIVNWKPESSAKCYLVELLNGYTDNVLLTLTCFQGKTHEFTGLSPNRIYGVQVSAISFECKKGPPSTPARTRTLWAPTTTTTTQPYITQTPKPSACGKKFFTCHSNKNECVVIEKWCNRRFDCSDESDERHCPGGCQEIDIEFKNGNYSCTRWGSPGSVCSFDCQEPYIRVGRSFTYCLRKGPKWRYPIPTCILRDTAMLNVVNDKTIGTTLTVEWEAVESAAGYALQVVELAGDQPKSASLPRTLLVDAADCCQAAIPNLKPETEFKITVRAVDEDGELGKKSSPVFVRTGKNKLRQEVE